MKINVFLFLFLLKFSFCNAQLYCDFIESKTFYKQSSFIKDAHISKEVIIVQQLKNRVLEDSFKIEVTNFNKSGKPVSKFSGSKWNLPVMQDTFDYSGNQLQITSVKDVATAPKVIDSESPTFKEPWSPKNDTISKGMMRYEWDSVNKVKKVFYHTKTSSEKLLELIFFDDQGRISKIDFAPESEKVRQLEYVYKKNKLKIYTVSATSRECNEEMKFNAMGQLAERKILTFSNRAWLTNRYIFTYYENGLVATETKKKDGQVYTVATHYYY